MYHKKRKKPCPVKGCGKTTEGAFCNDHWVHLPEDLRREVVDAQNTGNEDARYQNIYNATLYLEGYENDRRQ